MKITDIKKKEIIKMILFVALAGLMLWYSTVILNYPIGSHSVSREKCNEYKALRKNSIDVLFVGSSATDRFWIPAIGWKESGISSFALAMDGVPIDLQPEIISEALKTQKPKVIVVELRRAYRNADAVTEFRVRRVVDNFVTGRNLKAAADEIYRVAKKYDEIDIDYTDKSYRYPYIKYHNRWREITMEEILNPFPKTNQMGYPLNYRATFWQQVKLDAPDLSNEKAEINEYTEESINMLLDYCDTLDCEVVFSLTPMSMSKSYYERLNTAKEIVINRGYKVLDMNTTEFYNSVNLDFKKDFYNSNHANVCGGVKVTYGILEYLEENYDLENHKDDPKYQEEWGNIYEELKEIVRTHREEWLAILD